MPVGTVLARRTGSERAVCLDRTLRAKSLVAVMPNASVVKMDGFATIASSRVAPVQNDF